MIWPRPHVHRIKDARAYRLEAAQAGQEKVSAETDTREPEVLGCVTTGAPARPLRRNQLGILSVDAEAQPVGSGRLRSQHCQRGRPRDYLTGMKNPAVSQLQADLMAGTRGSPTLALSLLPAVPPVSPRTSSIRGALQAERNHAIRRPPHCTTAETAGQ